MGLRVVEEDDGEEQQAAEHSHRESTGIEIEARPDFSMLLDFTGSYCLAQCSSVPLRHTLHLK